LSWSAVRFGLLRYIWHPSLFVFAIYMIVLSSMVLAAAAQADSPTGHSSPADERSAILLIDPSLIVFAVNTRAGYLQVGFFCLQ
jgi:hypothetical protein